MIHLLLPPEFATPCPAKTVILIMAKYNGFEINL
jgi:hypothetical protein